MAATAGGGTLREDYLLDNQEVTIVDTMTPVCDGNSGSLGHPLEYLTLERGLKSVCKYCDRRFIYVTHEDVGKVRKEGTPFVV